MVLTANVATTRSTRRVNVIDRRSVWVRMDWVVVTSGAALLAVGTLLVWSATASNEALTGGDSTMYVAKHLTNVAIDQFDLRGADALSRSGQRRGILH